MDVFNAAINGLNFTQEVAVVTRFAPEVAPDLVVFLYNAENERSRA